MSQPLDLIGSGGRRQHHVFLRPQMFANNIVILVSYDIHRL
jgi:hypothetical protein